MINKETDMNHIKFKHLKISKNQIIRYFPLFILTFVVFFGIPVTISAQMPEEPTLLELEQFRTDLGLMTRELQASVEMLNSNPILRNEMVKVGANTPKRMPEMMTEMQKQLQNMSYEDLAVIYHAFRNNFPDWREAPQIIRNIADKVKTGNVSSNSKNSISFNAIEPDDCQEAFDKTPSWTDWNLARITAIKAQGVIESMPPDLAKAVSFWVFSEASATAVKALNRIYERCSSKQSLNDLQTAVNNIQTSQIEIINNDNTNRSILITAVNNAHNAVQTNIVDMSSSILDEFDTTKNLVTQAQLSILADAQSKVEILSTEINNIGNAVTNSVNNNLNGARAAIIANDNSNSNLINENITNTKDEIIANNNANRDAILNKINTNNNELRNLLLRAQIEADLASESNAVKVAWFITPTANGGHLDFVQQIVTETLANVLAAGGGIGNAQSFLDKANADKAAGKFKAAYDNYRKAYKEAIK